MKTFVFVISTIIIALATCPDAQAGEKKIIWYQSDFPPYVILKGQAREKGIQNQINEYLIKRLPEYEHTYDVANYSRILENLKNERHGVAGPVFKTPEREKYLFYSEIASFLALPNGFIINRADKE